METALKNQNLPQGNGEPLCPVFGQCGGCFYQNIEYSDELKIKEDFLKNLFNKSFDLADYIFAPIVSSPKPYYYRDRLDLKLKRTKAGDIFIGFSPMDKKGVLPVEACFIADQNISDFIPELKRQAIAQLPKEYKNANLTVRTGQDGQVRWGGIGRRSCQLSEQNYFWIDIEGKRIFYSLDTFFQANCSILPRLFDVINRFAFWDSTSTFYDFYGGVGLFSIGLANNVDKVIMIEENISSLNVARINVNFNKLDNVEIINGRVEDYLSSPLNIKKSKANVALIDPPRAGLSEQACQLLAKANGFKHILYLSCNPESLVHDLGEFIERKWKIQNIIPFDFFPKTKHLETLVLLQLEH